MATPEDAPYKLRQQRQRPVRYAYKNVAGNKGRPALRTKDGRYRRS